MVNNGRGKLLFSLTTKLGFVWSILVIWPFIVNRIFFCCTKICRDWSIFNFPQPWPDISCWAHISVSSPQTSGQEDQLLSPSPHNIQYNDARVRVHLPALAPEQQYVGRVSRVPCSAGTNCPLGLPKPVPGGSLRSREIQFPRQFNFGSHCVTSLIIQPRESTEIKILPTLGPSGPLWESISREFFSLCRLFIVLLWFLCFNAHRELYLVSFIEHFISRVHKWEEL